MTPAELDSLAAARAPVAVPQRLEAPLRSATAAAPARRSPRAWSLTCLAADGGMLVTAAAACILGASWTGTASPPAPWLIAFPLLVLTLFASRGMYVHRLRVTTLDHLRIVVAATTVAAMAVISARVTLGEPGAVAAETIRLWAFATVYLAAGRTALYWSQAQARRRGEGALATLIVGAGKVGRLTAERLLADRGLGLRPIGFLDKEPLASDEFPLIPVLGASWDLEDVVARHHVQHVIVAFSTAPNHVLLGIVKRCEQLGVSVSFVPRLFERVTRDTTVDHLGGLPLVTVQRPNPRGWQFAVKYALDRVLATVILVLASPVIAAGALAVLISLGRPLVYRQRRIGRDGRTFEILKLRTMRPSASSTGNGSVVALRPLDMGPGGVEGEDRRTRTGSFLRRTAIDELPQLFNVVRGDMSLVGPRPERPEFVELFERHVYRYEDRHRVKSGITGWAQVHGLRGKTSLTDRVEWDNYYIENWSLWLDFKILVMTAAAVLRFNEAE